MSCRNIGKPLAPLAFALLTIPGTGVLAQELPIPSVPGQTELQRNVGENINVVCFAFVDQANAGNAPVGEQAKFFSSCTRMVSSALSINDQQNPVPDFDMGLSAPQFATAIQAMAGEEALSKARGAVEMRSQGAIGARLLALRAGARGLNVSGMQFDRYGRPVGIASLLPKGARGGGASSDASPWGGFANLSYTDGDRDGTDREDGFDFSNFGITAGADYRISDALIVGGALSYDDSETDFDNDLGNVDTTAWGATIYGTYTNGNFYVDGHAGYSWVEYDTVRRINIPTNNPGSPQAQAFSTEATANPDGTQWSASIGAGYLAKLGVASVSPFVRLEYLRAKIDGFTESEPNEGLALEVDGRTVKSLQSVLGARVSYPISTSYGVVTPYASAQWNHEFDNDEAGVRMKFLNDPFSNGVVITSDSPDRNYFLWSLGAQALFARGVSGFVNFETVSGLSRTDYYTLTLGARMEF